MKLLDWIPLDKLSWTNLSLNPNAIHLLEQLLALPKVLEGKASLFLKQNIDKISWWQLSRNPNAIHLLEQNMDKIDWKYLSTNPNIFEIDTKQLKLDITEKAKIIDGTIYE